MYRNTPVTRMSHSSGSRQLYRRSARSSGRITMAATKYAIRNESGRSTSRAARNSIRHSTASIATTGRA